MYIAVLGLLLAAAPQGRIDALVRQMTLDEKLTLVHGARDPEGLAGAGYWPGIPRLHIPPLRFADGPPGINVERDSTAMPAPVALAATFDIEAARRFGIVLGREARALGQDVVLAPHANIVRDPRFRRNHTTLSEDPLLTARLAAAEIEGIQSQGVMAQVKHLAGYNGAGDVTIDARTLHEIYLPAFEAAVKAGVASVMCSYNRINGDWACENAALQNGILRGEFGFRGFVTSDWGAVHSPGAISKGVDLEMPGREIAGRPGGPYFTGPLKAAVESGAIPVSAVDEAVKRILAQIERFHLLDNEPAPGKIDVGADAEAVERIALESAVLLANDGALPLKPSDLESLALIGPTAGQLAAGYLGERGQGFENRLVSPYDALRKLAPQAKIAFATGDDWTGVPIPASLDKPLRTAPLAAGEYTWKGTLQIPEDGDYGFMVQTAVGGGQAGTGAISIDGKLAVRPGGPGLGGIGAVLKKWSSLLPTPDGRDNARAVLHLARGEHRIEFTASSEGDEPLHIRFAWTTPELRRANLEMAAEAARHARTAVVFASQGEGDLIEAVAGANPRTIVVLHTSGAVEMPWRKRVRAILEMWYPGQEGGWAAAKLLLGLANPSGKLPVTFPAKLSDGPSGDVYAEGIAVGYRWYDSRNIEPLFPFGHGLSYTRFEYSDAAVSGDKVAVTVRNAGSRAGAEVVQVYAGAPANAPVPMAVRSLAGFERVFLLPGQSKRVTLRMNPRAFSYWSVERKQWVPAAGRRTIYVGSSSRDIRAAAQSDSSSGSSSPAVSSSSGGS